MKPGNVAEYREAARRKLPAPFFHYIDGGADEERSLRRNSEAFGDIRFNPRTLADVSRIDTSTQLFGRDVAMPLYLSPTGMTRLFHHGKELAVARAAAEAGIFYSLSTMATTSIEDIAAASGGPKLFQIYIFRDRGLSREFVERAKVAGYDALALTVDTPVAGNRERDRRTGMTMPPRFGPESLLSFAMCPEWTFNFLRSPDFRLANVAHRVDALAGGAMGIIQYVNSQFDPAATWEDAAWLVREWGGRFIVKGVQSVEDAVRAKAIGATGIMISNHGGRQLDDVPAPIELLRPIRDAVGPDMELIVDGGVRRGSDVVKAVCMGANACSIGRPYLYGLAAGGQKGVASVLSIFRSEMERTMTLLGRTDIASLDESAIASIGA
ncbi:alpha-hydroxy acid oxidase [Sphingobium subterraneum]|uniref:L-lactate dehydrogenase (Cytochrome) n=1 Tax=Sphingobium subterraneum TaxID=627688 RepID=A0A841J544_9SPHN|nr:alpha-hydroxy acid oxidase [Sphingobium subterraneum]MBB6123685.1 L-lactate dehydrogenase (cytochrome) [Sphingobium subterraneum]